MLGLQHSTEMHVPGTSVETGCDIDKTEEAKGASDAPLRTLDFLGK